MPVAWHPKKWWDWCLSVDDRKRIEAIFTDKVRKCEKLLEGENMLKISTIQFGSISLL